MDVKQSSDIAQEVLEILCSGIDNVEVYIVEIGCFSHTFSNHICILVIIPMF